MYPATPEDGLAVQVSETEYAVPCATVMLKLDVAEFTGELESVTVNANDDVPTVVGTPVISPELLSAKPAGNEPDDTLQL